MEIITKLLYVKPDVARAQPTIRKIPDISDTSWQLWLFLTAKHRHSKSFSEEETLILAGFRVEVNF